MTPTPHLLAAQPPTMVYQQLVRRGLLPTEAANLTAVLAGIPIAVLPWTLREIAHLLFLRSLRDRGGFRSDDRVTDA